MRILILIILWLSTLSLWASEIFAVKEGPDRFSYYVQDSSDPGLYYKSGVRTSPMALRPTPFIKIAFIPEADPDAIMTPYSLRLVKAYPAFRLYEALSPQEAVAIASKIWEEPGVRSAVPLFERKKQLQ